jgi:hypothetical protein
LVRGDPKTSLRGMQVKALRFHALGRKKLPESTSLTWLSGTRPIKGKDKTKSVISSPRDWEYETGM